MQTNVLTWQDTLALEKQQPYFQELVSKVNHERADGKTIYPPNAEVFHAFVATDLANIKVVILGQDPYHGPEQAHGLAFSVRKGVKIPPSLRNMYKELSTDIDGFQIPEHGDLNHWAEQGVLLLNTVLTVEAGQAHSHAKWGWERFTDKVVDVINQYQQQVVFMLWGSHAQKKGAMIDRSRHLVLESVHPSPLSAHRGFFGCRHFSQANQYLIQTGQAPIDWQV
ncbi:uracil-DNA glycosylase [Vitreoscilla massiliensis]|uniref:Uracil-DNA glycosylase n=1 Tax=Vitreoscilla massiliensis TaxID=1689272 RepID=A0ABY4E368_9NEIS|nr:uracil-DNA glycosylase [Vitreoscilla massiliensis]UOO90217.1 uracil-DNA glycosylase [Vitreoscilla massiliensis]